MNDETYIKMCDCVEIQEQRPRRVVYDREYNKYESHSFFVIRGDAKPSCKCGKYGRDWFGEIVCDRCGTTIEPLIWLPTQAQLQEMVSGQFFTYEGSDEAKMPNPAGMIHCFSEFYNERYEYASYETAWLAFVMKELHNKIWTGEAWIGGNE